MHGELKIAAKVRPTARVSKFLVVPATAVKIMLSSIATTKTYRLPYISHIETASRELRQNPSVSNDIGEMERVVLTSNSVLTPGMLATYIEGIKVLYWEVRAYNSVTVQFSVIETDIMKVATKGPLATLKRVFVGHAIGFSLSLLFIPVAQFDVLFSGAPLTSAADIIIESVVCTSSELEASSIL